MRRLIPVALLLLTLFSGSALSAESKGTDVRVLIDISGSMRQNDPDNLRRPAMRMMVGLLQPDTKAGVWTFARWVNMLVPHGKVDAAWKKKATALSKKINSPGQFTNIEDVLERASRNWKPAPDADNRHLVLLTDGMVDVSKNAEENAASRERILNQLVPRLKKAGARVHAIALSDRADHELMRQLAVDTEGWYQQVASAEELQRVFLKIFEKVGRPEGVPLKGNAFQIDRSIKEATVLVFRGLTSPTTRLHAPDGHSYEGSDLPAGVAWHADEGYDLITIDDPMAGEWRLEADADPDNRVMIVTDLKLETSALPNRLAVDEFVNFGAHLSNKGKLIDKRAFLDLVTATATSKAADGTQNHEFADRGGSIDSAAGDGRYSMRFGANMPRGEVQLRVRTESATFTREKRFAVDIVAPAALTVVDEASTPLVQLDTEGSVVKQVNVLELYQEDETGQRVRLESRETAPGQWQANLQDSAWPVKADLEFSTLAGNLIQKTLGPVYAPGYTAPPAPEPVSEPVPKPIAAPEPEVVEPVTEAPPVAAEPEVVEEESSMLMSALIFGGVNLLLIAAGGLAWWFMRRRKAGKGDGDDDEINLLPDDDAAPSPELADAETPKEEAA